MRVTKASGKTYRADYRLESSFVYMVLCQEKDGPIYVKVGLSDAPVKRFQALRTGCPVPPRRLALCAVPSRFIARRVEAFLLEEFASWRTRGEWFRFKKEDKTAFNAGWQRAFRRSAPRGWPLEWTHLPVAPLLEKWARNMALVKKFIAAGRKRHTAYRYFLNENDIAFLPKKHKGFPDDDVD